MRIQALGGRTIDAKVSRTAYALDASTRTLRVEADVPNTDGTLRPGLYINANVVASVAWLWALAVVTIADGLHDGVDQPVAHPGLWRFSQWGDWHGLYLPGALLMLEPDSGDVTSTVPTPSEPIDVLVAARAPGGTPAAQQR